MHACVVMHVAGRLVCCVACGLSACTSDSDDPVLLAGESPPRFASPTLDARPDSSKEVGDATTDRFGSDAHALVPPKDAGYTDGRTVRQDESGVPPFSIRFVGTGFEDHEGTTVYAALVRSNENRIVVEGFMRIYKGQFGFAWSHVLTPGVAYHVDYFCDLNGNGLCDQPPLDHVVREKLPATASDILFRLVHTERQNPAGCVAF